MSGMSAAKATKIGSISALVCCLGCCAIPGVAALIIFINTVLSWPAVNGTVVDSRLCSDSHVNSDNRQSEPTYYVMYNYITSSGQNITSETEYCTSNVPEEGEIMPISYDPEDPERIFEKAAIDLGLKLARSATGLGFAFSVIALCVLIFMCTRPNNTPTAYQTNTYEANNTYDNNNNKYNANNNSSVPVSGPAGDIPTPAATAVRMQPAQVYTNSSTPASSGPVTFYK